MRDSHIVKFSKSKNFSKVKIDFGWGCEIDCTARLGELNTTKLVVECNQMNLRLDALASYIDETAKIPWEARDVILNRVSRIAATKCVGLCINTEKELHLASDRHKKFVESLKFINSEVGNMFALLEGKTLDGGDLMVPPSGIRTWKSLIVRDSNVIKERAELVALWMLQRLAVILLRRCEPREPKKRGKPKGGTDKSLFKKMLVSDMYHIFNGFNLDPKKYEKGSFAKVLTRVFECLGEESNGIMKYVFEMDGDMAKPLLKTREDFVLKGEGFSKEVAEVSTLTALFSLRNLLGSPE